MDYSYYVRKYFCQICKFKASWGVSKIVKFTFFCDLTWPFCTKISLMPSLGLYRQISNFFFCISSFDAKTSMYAKNHENLGHGMCHPLPGFSLDRLLICLLTGSLHCSTLTTGMSMFCTGAAMTPWPPVWPDWISPLVSSSCEAMSLIHTQKCSTNPNAIVDAPNLSFKRL